MNNILIILFSLLYWKVNPLSGVERSLTTTSTPGLEHIGLLQQSLQ